MASVERKTTSVVAEMQRAVNTARAVKVGFLRGATYPDGTPVAAVAAYNEYGTLHAPPRPFFRGMIADKQTTWGPAMATLLKDQEMSAARALDLAGQAIKGQLQQAINEFEGAPLAARTVARKGHDKQLIDTAHMLNSVDYEVI